MGVALEPGFNWWVFRDVKYLKKTHKYGLPLPKLVEDALSIDRRSGSTLGRMP